MNNILRILLIFILVTSCSLHKNSKFWTSTKKIKKEEVVNSNLVKECSVHFFIKRCKTVIGAEEIFIKEEAIALEYNSNKRITLYGKPINKSFFNNYDNNNGRINYDGSLKRISKLKFFNVTKKID